MTSSFSRRVFVRGAALATASIATASLASGMENGSQAVNSLSGNQKEPGHEAHDVYTPVPETFLKFTAKGDLRPFAGNTVLAHLPAQSPFRDAAVDLRSSLAAATFARKLALLPNDSFHMTIYSGANDQDRASSSWPEDVPLTSSIEECNKTLEARMQTARLSVVCPLRVKLDVPATLSYPQPCSLRMEGADREAERNLRSLRDQLANLYRHHAPDHDQYGFHISVAYTIGRFTETETREFQQLLNAHVPKIVGAAPILELALPEYCIFRDMYRYDVVKMLRVS